MNILLVTQFLSTTKGGGEYLFSLMANLLAANGHKIWIITHKIQNEDYSHFHKNIRIEFVSSIGYEGGLPTSFIDNIKFVLQSIFKGAMLIKKNKIEIIHSNNFTPALSGSILSSITGCSHITTMWDVFSLCGKNFWKKWSDQKGISRLHSFLGPRFEKLILRMHHHAIHTISDMSREDLINFGAKKPIHVINPSIEMNKFKNFTPNNFQFVYVGRLVFYKNLETIIKAVSIVKKTHQNIKLKIIGGGPYKNNLVQLRNELGLESNIEFSGYVTEEEKYETISSSIAMVFPSLCEGFGLVILESFLCQRPVIVSNIRPLSDIVDNQKDGFVLEPKNFEEWTKAMNYFIENPNEAVRMGKTGKEKLERCYSQDSMIKQIESMYNKVTSINHTT